MAPHGDDLLSRRGVPNLERLVNRGRHHEPAIRSRSARGYSEGVALFDKALAMAQKLTAADSTNTQ